MALQVLLSMEFPRQGYWRGLSFPSTGDLPNPGIEPWFTALQADSLPMWYMFKKTTGNSLVVRWLGLDAFIARAWVQSLVRDQDPASHRVAPTPPPQKMKTKQTNKKKTHLQQKGSSSR